MSRMMPGGAIAAMRLGLLASALPLLSGCVAAAAVAVPALTGAGIFSERQRKDDGPQVTASGTAALAGTEVTSGSPAPATVAGAGASADIPAAQALPGAGIANPAYVAPGADGAGDIGPGIPAPTADGSTIRTMANPAYQPGAGAPQDGTELASVARPTAPPAQAAAPPASSGQQTSEQGIPAALAVPGRIAPPAAMASSSSGDWADFASFALRRAEARKRGEAANSVILTTESAFSLKPEQPPCEARDSAVVIDLDRGAGSLSPGIDTVPAAGLAQALAQLRSAGLVVLWISSLHGNDITKVGDALRKSGLDPAGRDPILLAKHDGERKQVMRAQANEDVCVVAMAGDQRADFDELFDFLQNPGDATPLDPMIGKGWFLAPPPLGLLGQEGR